MLEAQTALEHEADVEYRSLRRSALWSLAAAAVAMVASMPLMAGPGHHGRRRRPRNDRSADALGDEDRVAGAGGVGTVALHDRAAIDHAWPASPHDRGPRHGWPALLCRRLERCPSRHGQHEHAGRRRHRRRVSLLRWRLLWRRTSSFAMASRRTSTSKPSSPSSRWCWWGGPSRRGPGSQTAGALRALVSLQPATARLVQHDGIEIDVPVGRLRLGDLVARQARRAHCRRRGSDRGHERGRRVDADGRARSGREAAGRAGLRRHDQQDRRLPAAGDGPRRRQRARPHRPADARSAGIASADAGAGRSHQCRVRSVRVRDGGRDVCRLDGADRQRRDGARVRGGHLGADHCVSVRHGAGGADRNHGGERPRGRTWRARSRVARRSSGPVE